MLRNPHVVTELSSVRDLILDERNRLNIELLSSHLSASEAGIATSVEKAFVNLRFNDLSTSASADDSFPLEGFSPQQRSLGAPETLSHSH